MRAKYDTKSDILSLVLTEPIVESYEGNPGFILDYDGAGNLVGLEVLDASTYVSEVQTMEFRVTG